MYGDSWAGWAFYSQSSSVFLLLLLLLFAAREQEQNVNRKGAEPENEHFSYL